jgi:uncharacterized protein
MQCPACNVALVMSERSGVEIDYCPKCRGIWLDRGELDKIIERSESGAPANGWKSGDAGDRPGHGGYDDHHRPGDHQPRGYEHRRKSFWREIFD